ncbi:2088_t:CDS:2 [Acaulospora morrowiae]|uniref:GrpE protein homolog, mitochondrial n=1 Tax=Acaulospora morrowiae TaxID=94023 RepID=A0A9N8ZSY0_9GLOM|nr:2088_t:CDS:2 [Acaulospora morrowiae]
MSTSTISSIDTLLKYQNLNLTLEPQSPTPIKKDIAKPIKEEFPQRNLRKSEKPLRNRIFRPEDLKLNTKIKIFDQCGVIRFIGPTSFATGKWVGIELDSPLGKNDGSVNGKRYFVCKENHGIFARASKITEIIDDRGETDEETRNPLIAAARSLAAPTVIPPHASRNASTVSARVQLLQNSLFPTTPKQTSGSRTNRFAQFSTTISSYNKEESTNTNVNDNNASDGEKAPEKPTGDEDSGSEVDPRDKEIALLKDKHLRCLAELENQREIARREIENTSLFAIQKFAKDLLSTVDNLDLALESVPRELRESHSSEESSSLHGLMTLYKGIELTSSELLHTLKRHGVEKVEPKIGERFDPKVHEALYQASFKDKEVGTIFDIQKIGYSLNGRVIRSPQVGVVSDAEQ